MARSTTKAPGASAILAMHARYEAAWDEYNAIDAANFALGKEADLSLKFGYETGLRDNSTETDLLRHAILHQVPDTDEELAVLAFHAWGIFDYDQNTEDDRTALAQALNSIFDYLVGEGRVDMAKMGYQFNAGANITYRRRRFRTGMAGGEA